MNGNVDKQQFDSKKFILTFPTVDDVKVLHDLEVSVLSGSNCRIWLDPWLFFFSISG